MTDVRRATTADADLVAGICAAGFYNDPVLRWVFADQSTRLERLRLLFFGLSSGFVPDQGVIYLVDDAGAALWRDPSFDHHRAAARGVETADERGDENPGVFAADELQRLSILVEVMNAAHPHEPHWYLNVISTRPERQGQGLGARLLEPVLEECDAHGIPAYLESSNPRNMTLYRRHRFADRGDPLDLPDGPALYPMWRDPA